MGSSEWISGFSNLTVYFNSESGLFFTLKGQIIDFREGKEQNFQHTFASELI